MIESGKGSDVKWDNKLGFIILPFFIGKHSDPLDYVRKAKKVVDRKKSSLEVVFTHLAAEVILKVFGLKVHIFGPLCCLGTNGNMQAASYPREMLAG
jgi:hypothetical protein